MLYILLSKTKAATYNVMYVYPFIVVFVEECAFMRPVHVILSKTQTYFFTWLQTEHETVRSLIMNSYHLCVDSANKIYMAPSKFIYLTYNDRTHLINLTK